MNLRLFVALEPPELVRRRLGALQAELKRAGGRYAADVKWVPPENIHLTLQFLGGVPDARTGDVERALADAAVTSSTLALEVRGAGGFPNARRPRVLWAGIAGDIALLGTLAMELGRRLAPLGFPPEERPFSPHLTLGRARDPRGVPGMAAALDSVSTGPGAPWRAQEVVLFQSHLSPAGPRYEALARVPLGASR